MKGANSTYFGNVGEGITSTLNAIALTMRHLWDARRKRKGTDVTDKNYFDKERGIVTLEYPFEAIPVPDNGRYRLHNEIDDCIVCDLCAKVCPVNCIDIEPVKAIEEIGKTSDGSPKRIYAAKFDIDMAKCCYCGLCTTVCPTECLTMTKTYDYSEFDVRNMLYHFTDLSPEQSEQKKKEYEELQKQKAAAKVIADKAKAEGSVQAGSAAEGAEERKTELPKPKPIFKPKINIPKKDGDTPKE